MSCLAVALFAEYLFWIEFCKELKGNLKVERWEIKKAYGKSMGRDVVSSRIKPCKTMTLLQKQKMYDFK